MARTPCRTLGRAEASGGPMAHASFTLQQILLCKVIRCMRERVFAGSNAAKKHGVHEDLKEDFDYLHFDFSLYFLIE